MEAPPLGYLTGTAGRLSGEEANSALPVDGVITVEDERIIGIKASVEDH